MRRFGISEEEKHFHKVFTKTIDLNKENRHKAKFLFKETYPLFYHHYKFCEKCLGKFYSRLKDDIVLLKECDAIIFQQKKFVTTKKIKDSCGLRERHFRTYRPVLQDDKDSTKVRIVLDVPAKTERVNLNNCLYKSP